MSHSRTRSFHAPRFLKIGGVLVVAMWFAVAISSSAQTFTVLANFNQQSGTTLVMGSLIQGLDGNFYDTSVLPLNGGPGSVFKVSPAGEVTTLYKFCSLSLCSDGNIPWKGLVMAANGLMYGTTVYGGAAGQCTGGVYPGCGTIFQITPDGVLTTLHSFSGTDGQWPPGPLVLGADGNLYGTTSFGGNSNAGTVFMVTPGGSFTTLSDFCNSLGCFGANSNALIQGADGNFYGTTAESGNDNGGTVFKITPQGVLTSFNLCTQTACNGGSFPIAPLVQAANRNFYGTASAGGNTGTSTVCGQSGSGGYGGIFEITADGTLTSLYTFQDSSDGSAPAAALIQATDGNLYGTTECGGGNSSAGTIFSITASGTFTPLYSFIGAAAEGGSEAQVGLLQGTDGNFYGTTPANGTNNNGTVFRFSMGLSPFVKALPTSGGVGTIIQILGTSLMGSTAVSFNGTAATFTVASDSNIQATVPSGATSGPVTVTTANGTLSSNQPFQVTAQVATPVFSPAAGLFPSAQTVTISDATPSATIYYTTDGTNPTASSTAYSGLITVSLTETIEAIAVASGLANSPVASATYGIQTPPPTFSLAAGIYASKQTLTISDAMAGAAIYYSTGTPTLGSTLYNGPITISSTETIGAIAVASGYSASTVTSALYIIGAPFTIEPTPGSPTEVVVSPGGTATYALTLAPSGVPTIPVGVTFSASGLPSGASATFSPNLVTSGAGSTSVTMNIDTGGSSAQIRSGKMTWVLAFCVLLVPLAGTRRSRKQLARRVNGTTYLLAVLLLCTLFGTLVGCGKLGALVGNAPSSQTYTVTITATGGGTTTTSATTTVLLKVRG
jgi:uncharacterized repeat protein (TIGR03803 family)